MTNSFIRSFFEKSQVDLMLADFNTQPHIKEIGHSYVTPDEGVCTEAVFDLPTTLPLVQPLATQLSQVYKRPLRFANTYTRKYVNGSQLKIHTDREGLDVTVSLALQRDVPWALHVSPVMLDEPWDSVKHRDHSDWTRAYASYDLHLGDIAHCYGRKNPHWRSKLVCEPHQSNIYVFFHWTFL